MSEDKIAVVLSSVDALKAKGVTAIKVELEAQMYRRNVAGEYRDDDCEECEEGRRECYQCDGRGYFYCDNCDDGVVERNSEGVITVRCEECDGHGHETCSECEGQGDYTCNYCDGNWEADTPPNGQRNWARESVCFDWIMNRVAELTNTTRNDTDSSYEAINPFEWMRFARFYNDGSVDSELTFTVPIDDRENIRHLPKVVQAFKDLSDAVGQGFDVSGAGMHMAVIFSSDASYPTGVDNRFPEEDSQSHRLPDDQLVNFQRSMTQLLPALFFLASTNEDSRGLRYRAPRVSIGRTHANPYQDTDKYSAIVYRYGAFEFRVFDTCYQTPDAILDNVVVIANSMKYLTSTYRSPGIDRITRELRFGNEVNSKLERFFVNEQHLDVLNAGLEKLKPSYYTITEIKSQRKFARNRSTLANLRKEQQERVETEYQEYEERFNWQATHFELSRKSEIMRRLIARKSVAQLRELTMEALESEVQQELALAMQDYQHGKTEKERYIRNRMNDYETSTVGQFSLSFN